MAKTNNWKKLWFLDKEFVICELINSLAYNRILLSRRTRLKSRMTSPISNNCRYDTLNITIVLLALYQLSFCTVFIFLLFPSFFSRKEREEINFHLSLTILMEQFWRLCTRVVSLLYNNLFQWRTIELCGPKWKSAFCSLFYII